jgi:hypothetical protein
MTAIAPKSRVLKEYYSFVITLSTYLDALLPSKAQQWTQHDDPESFRHLLTTTLVGTEIQLTELPTFLFFPPAFSQSEARVFFCRERRDPDGSLDHGSRPWATIQNRERKAFQRTCSGVQSGMCGRTINLPYPSLSSLRLKIVTKSAS